MDELSRQMCGVNIIVKRGDITKEDVDIIVNAANSRLAGGGGVDGAIHAAGGPDIMAECNKIGFCHPGEAVYTTAGRLPARYCIHTVGPIWHGGTRNEESILKNCYLNSLRLAKKLGGKKVAFPAISCGVYGYPLKEAANIALGSVYTFLKSNKGSFEEIRFVLFNDTVYKIFTDVFKRIF